MGDEVIRAVGLVLRQSLRPTDRAGRYGGDEFAVLCPGADLAEAHAIAQRVCDGSAALYSAKRAGRNRVASSHEDEEAPRAVPAAVAAAIAVRIGGAHPLAGRSTGDPPRGC